VPAQAGQSNEGALLTSRIRILIQDAAVDRKSDEFRSPPDAEFGFDLTEVVGNGLIAYLEGVGDLLNVSAFRKKAQNFEIAVRQRF